MGDEELVKYEAKIAGSRLGGQDLAAGLNDDGLLCLVHFPEVGELELLHAGHKVNDRVHVPLPLNLESVELCQQKPKVLHCIVPCHLLQEQAQVL